MVSHGDPSPYALINHLDSVFNRDPHIDELGIVHPSQISSLRFGGPCTVADAKGSTPLPNAPGAGAEGEACSSCEGSGVAAYDDLVFYCGDHKLAIALPAVRSLYGAATAMFSVARDKYRALLEANNRDALYADCAAGIDKDAAENLFAVKAGLEDKILSSSRALVLVNCDHASAWNARKRILLSRGRNQDALDSELRLASIVLSCGPKSEEAWAHRCNFILMPELKTGDIRPFGQFEVDSILASPSDRLLLQAIRWVLKLLFAAVLKSSIMDCFLADESQLVEQIAERSPMNYRAWRHRCWLVSLMSLSQVMIELRKTKSWAQCHVSDNCCFHYRRCLLLRALETSSSNPSCYESLEGVDEKAEPCVSEIQVPSLLKKELAWNRQLLQQYIGHEALWMHRRFLLGLCLSQSSDGQSDQNQLDVKGCHALLSNMSVRDELMMADACISSCIPSSQDGMRQREFAASYKLWVLALVCKESRPVQNGRAGLLHGRSNIETLLVEVSAHRCRLWNGVVFNILGSLV